MIIDVRKVSLGRMMLALVIIGIVGLIAELFLLGHTESFNQWIPLISLAAGLIATIAVWLRPNRSTLSAFKIVMYVFVAAGLLGVYLHFAGNVEWAHERDPDLGGLQLVWKALKGATPSLAPGALAQLGLLGLIFAWSNPGATKQTDNPPLGDTK
ncbi:MAG: hypothetical protein ABI556_10960 [Gemmatimonadales bacterium]